MKRALLWVVSSLFLMLGCKKVELPPPVVEDPVFSAELNWANGETLSLSAGESQYYLFTEYEQDSLDVFSFTGRFEQIDCLDQCGPSFSITIRDREALPSGLPQIEGSLQPDLDFGFVEPATTTVDSLFLYQLDLQALVNTMGTVPNLEWYLNDTLMGQTPAASYLFSYLPSLEVCLEASNLFLGCQANQCRQIDWSLPSCNVVLSTDSVGSNFLEAIGSGGQMPYSYLWSTGETTASISTNGVGTYCVTLTDQNGCESSSCTLLPQSPAQAPCFVEMAYQTQQILDTVLMNVSDSLFLSKVILEYSVEGGASIYRSDRQQQGSGASFDIVSIEPYEPNEQGQSTYLVEANFTARLWDESGNFVDIQSGTAIFAVAYPE
ncbi:MAG: hypothetical protein KDC43_27625 [Saprospiraceae bacterium]|nr:hypothetical protein [Saprospiraceae bacterium]MCB0627590.1 hypothetical protein [Saprospiraceae bacterium]MCB0675635.1 hypothetical protein [Saprospiraceae bacterium]MCB0680267.1 hypothetical protein [Saprospiraceae bacterium]